ncbi:MAG TPA: flagellar assembly protein FliW [Bryobacteraceae bacterium]|jgi:flagellar assembly factor FliW|nr:flagellar assembly protein FliW [Bryobacteraceae bacterium]
MPETETANFGTISFAPESVFEFPHGLPGFEDRRRFLPVQHAGSAPIVFLQSMEDPSLCFTTLPIWVIDPQYRLHVTEQDLELLGFPPDRQPGIGADVLCLAVLSIRPAGATANLLAPVVVNLKNYKAVQAVSAESGYSHQHALFPEEVAAC